MSIHHALFIDGAWTDTNGDSWSALVAVEGEGILIRPYSDAEECTDKLCLSLAEFDAIAEMVAKLRVDRPVEAQP